MDNEKRLNQIPKALRLAKLITARKISLIDIVTKYDRLVRSILVKLGREADLVKKDNERIN